MTADSIVPTPGLESPGPSLIGAVRYVNGKFYGCNGRSWAELSGVAGLKVYRATLVQSGDADAPVATILENTLGSVPAWSRQATGIYVLTLEGAFTLGRTIVAVGVDAEQSGANSVTYGQNSADTVTMSTYWDGSLEELDGPAYIEVFVYP